MCGCSILLTSVLSQWYSTYGWMNIQDVISGWVEVWLKHQATGLATLATCHSPPFEKGAHVRFLLSCWCIHLCIYKASPLPAYLCSSKKRTDETNFTIFFGVFFILGFCSPYPSFSKKIFSNILAPPPPPPGRVALAFYLLVGITSTSYTIPAVLFRLADSVK